MRRPLTLAVAQPLTAAHDVSANVGRHADLVRSAGARVVVFPELSLTGYELDADPVAPDDPRLAPLVTACAATGSVALAGAPVAGNGGAVHLGVLRVDGEGAAVVYRKMFLGADEEARFTASDAPGVIEVDGWRLGLAVCKDTGVELHAALTCAAGIDVYVAGVLEAAADADVQPGRARRIARDHGVWVAVASFAGSTGGGFDEAAGGSFVLSPAGEVVAQVGAAVGAVITATVPLEPGDASTA